MKKNILILIADSGSSKTSWAGLEKGEQVFSFETLGLNPNFLSESEFLTELNKLALQLPPQQKVQVIYFYGAGCSSEKNKKFVQQSIASVITAEKVIVESDLQAAALAVSHDKQSITAIIGTGSNACLFDGSAITFAVPSYGYIFGDYGSGAAIGKVTLQKYFDGELPKEVADSFIKWLGLTEQEIIEEVYKRSRPNRFLATITLFHALHSDESSLRKIRLESFHSFFTKQLNKIKNADQFEINFCGSVAWVFREEIKFIANETGYHCGTFVKSPMEGLVSYFKKK